MEIHNQSYLNFLETWNVWITGISVVIMAAGALIFFYYFVGKLNVKGKGYKKEYDYINDNEINMFWYSILAITIGVGLWLNVSFNETIKEAVIFFFVRLFVTSSFITIFVLAFNSLVKVYYPFFVEKQLNRLRHQPRINPNNGSEMRLLSEDEEDLYLTSEQIEEESMRCVDYDVWLDEKTGYQEVEKYDGACIAIECPSCKYRTLRVEKEEVVRTATVDREGEILNYYKCSFCNYRERQSLATRELRE